MTIKKISSKPAASKGNYYIDNEKLYQEMVKYIAEYRAAKEAGTELPRVTRYIGQCIKLISEKLSTSRQFVAYSYREDMIGDGIENCLRYIHNFDPEKTRNPFAYFTQIMYYAFLRKIEKEHKQSYIKLKSMENSIVMNTLVDLAPDDQAHFNTIVSTMDYDKLTKLSEKYEASKPPKKVAKDAIKSIFNEEDGVSDE